MDEFKVTLEIAILAKQKSIDELQNKILSLESTIVF